MVEQRERVRADDDEYSVIAKSFRVACWLDVAWPARECLEGALADAPASARMLSVNAVARTTTVPMPRCLNMSSSIWFFTTKRMI